MVANLVSAPSTCLISTGVDAIFYILAANSFTFLPGLPIPSQKFKVWSQYEPCVSFYSNIQDTFFFNNNLWNYPYFLLEFNLLLTTTMSPVSKFLVRFSLLISSLCLRLLFDANILNSNLLLNRSGDVDSKWSKSFCPYEVPYLHLSGYISIVNGNSLPISDTDQAISVSYTGPSLLMYNLQNNPYNH